MYGQKLNWFQRLMQRFQPTPAQVAAAELKEAELALLQSHSEREYAALRTQMHELTADYHTRRIGRLKRFLGHDVPGPYIKGFGSDGTIHVGFPSDEGWDYSGVPKANPIEDHAEIVKK